MPAPSCISSSLSPFTGLVYVPCPTTVLLVHSFQLINHLDLLRTFSMHINTHVFEMPPSHVLLTCILMSIEEPEIPRPENELYFPCMWCERSPHIEMFDLTSPVPRLEFSPRPKAFQKALGALRSQPQMRAERVWDFWR